MSGIRHRIVAAFGVLALGLGGVVGVGALDAAPAAALSNPASPWLTLQRTIGSQPWGGGGTSAFDIEGMAYLPFDNQLVVADDSADRLYFVDHTTGALLRTIPQSAFSSALPLGATGPAAGVGRADAFRAVIYDPNADTLYVFSGNCCGATGPYEPTAFRLKRDASNAFQVESYQPLPEGTDAVAGAILPGHGIYIGRGTRIRHYSYSNNTIGADIQLTGTGTNLLGMSFPDADTMIATNSANQIIKVSTATWTAVPGWTLDAGVLGVQQARSVAILNDEFMIADGGDTRAPTDPLKYAIFIADLGEAPPLSAVFTPTVTSGPAPLGVWFIDHSIGATSYQWDFGDGTGATTSSTAHIFAAGNYTVTLRVTSPSGSSRASVVIHSLPSNGRKGGYTLDGYGGLHPFGTLTDPAPPAVRKAASWPGWDIARGVALRFDGTGGYTLDAYGGLHPFGIGSSAIAPATTQGPYWVGWDAARGVALMPNGKGGYVVDLYGGVHRFRIGSGPLPPNVNSTPYWLGLDVARGISVLPDGSGGYIVDRLGALHPFGIGSHRPPPLPTNIWVGNDRRGAQGVAVLDGGRGGYTIEGTGVIHRFTTTKQSPAVVGAPEWPTWDIARDIAVLEAT
ncbi:MAG: PKD domain-containing protein [Acidimicrobiia bacterium]